MPEQTDSEEPQARKVGSSYAFHAALFLLTLVSTTMAGARNVDPEGGDLLQGLSYSIPLMAILVCHEFGHYIAARVHGVPASLPYFIPLPPFFLFGTMGAVIRMGESADRRKLLDIGAAGPLAGLVVAIPVLIYGLSLSEVMPVSGNSLQEGNSLLYAGLKMLVKGRFLPDEEGMDIWLHPTAFAGWAGLFITMINLLPFGQLDGGHIAMAFFGNRYSAFARRYVRALPVLSLVVFVWVWRLAAAAGPLDPPDLTPTHVAVQAALPWAVWFGLLKLMRRLSGGVDHPPVADMPLGRRRRALFWIVAVAFILIFMPVPMRMSFRPPGAPAPAPTSAPYPEESPERRP